jgi:hypothetical protein
MKKRSQTYSLKETRRHQIDKWQACVSSYELLTGLLIRISLQDANSYPDPGVKIAVEFWKKLF